jgi:hypothetical protein
MYWTVSDACAEAHTRVVATDQAPITCHLYGVRHRGDQKRPATVGEPFRCRLGQHRIVREAAFPCRNHNPAVSTLHQLVSVLLTHRHEVGGRSPDTVCRLPNSALLASVTEMNIYESLLFCRCCAPLEKCEVEYSNWPSPSQSGFPSRAGTYLSHAAMR